MTTNGNTVERRLSVIVLVPLEGGTGAGVVTVPAPDGARRRPGGRRGAAPTPSRARCRPPARAGPARDAAPLPGARRRGRRRTGTRAPRTPRSPCSPGSPRSSARPSGPARRRSGSPTTASRRPGWAPRRACAAAGWSRPGRWSSTSRTRRRARRSGAGEGATDIAHGRRHRPRRASARTGCRGVARRIDLPGRALRDAAPAVRGVRPDDLPRLVDGRAARAGGPLGASRGRAAPGSASGSATCP